MPVTLTCKNCHKTYSKTPCLVDISKFCSISCKREFHGWTSAPNASCGSCGKKMHLKPSKLKSLKHPPCCSRECMGRQRIGIYSGSKNPNYRGRTINSDGYRIMPPYSNGFRDVSDEALMHKAVAARELGVRKIKGFHVHHRDCDVLNNQPENLAVLEVSDHKWLHKQFGNATLWAAMKGKVSFDDLVSWSDNPERAARLLSECVTRQIAENIGQVDGTTLKPISKAIA